MNNIIFCGQCGNENPIENNYCIKCGQKLTHVSEELTKTNYKTASDIDYLDIKETLDQLIKTNGFSIISIGDYYVQFSNNLSSNQINFEAVSCVFLKSVGNKDKEFYKIGFSRDTDSNYYKVISLTDFSVDQIVGEIKTIFESIYHITLTSYNIETDFEYLSDIQTAQDSNNTKTTKNRRKNNNFGYLIVIIIALIFGLNVIMNADDRKSNTEKSEIVSNSEYDASVYQVENYLKTEYLRDPDSYQSIEWSKVQKDKSKPNYKYYVRHKFRAKNGFGGYVVEEKIFYLDQFGNVVSFEDYQ